MAFTKLLRSPSSIAAIVLALTSDSSGASLLATERITGMIGCAGPCVRIRKWPVTRTAGTKIRPSRAFPPAPLSSTTPMTVNVPDPPCEAADADNPPSDRTGLSPEPPGQVRADDDRTRGIATGTDRNRVRGPRECASVKSSRSAPHVRGRRATPGARRRAPRRSGAPRLRDCRRHSLAARRRPLLAAPRTAPAGAPAPVRAGRPSLRIAGWC